MYCDKICSMRPAILFSILFAVTMFAAPIQAQDNSKPFEARFWQFLMGNNYKNWAPAPGQDGNFYSGQVPHGALLKMYVNRSAASNVAGLKIGSVIVLENYRSDRSLKSISVMYRTEGFNPSANDWYWVEYNPDGSVVSDAAADQSQSQSTDISASSQTKMVGKGSRCISCHNQAGGSDFAFFNDQGNANVAGGRKTKATSLR